MSDTKPESAVPPQPPTPVPSPAPARTPTRERSKPIEWWTLGSVFAIGLMNLAFTGWTKATIEKPRLRLETEAHAAEQAALKQQRPIIQAEVFDTGTTIQLGGESCLAQSVYVDIRNESDAPCDVQDITLRVFYCDLHNVTRVALLPPVTNAAEAGGKPRIVAVLDHRDPHGWVELPELKTVRAFSSGPIVKGQSRRETFHLMLGGDFRIPFKYEVDVSMSDGGSGHLSWVGFSQTALCYPVPTGPVGGPYSAPAGTLLPQVEEAPSPPDSK